MIMTEVEMPDAEQGGEDTPADLTDVVIAEVDGGELVKLREGSSWHIEDLIVGDIQELDALLILHRDLGEVGQLVVGSVKMEGIAELIERILVNISDNVVRNI